MAPGSTSASAGAVCGHLTCSNQAPAGLSRPGQPGETSLTIAPAIYGSPWYRPRPGGNPIAHNGRGGRGAAPGSPWAPPRPDQRGGQPLGLPCGQGPHGAGLAAQGATRRGGWSRSQAIEEAEGNPVHRCSWWPGRGRGACQSARTGPVLFLGPAQPGMCPRLNIRAVLSADLYASTQAMLFCPRMPAGPSWEI